MKGRTFLIGSALLLAAFTVGLWYTQFYAWYEELPQQPLFIADREVAVESWQAIDGASSPLKLRICVTVTPETATRLANILEVSEPGDPLVPPDWFDCFNAKEISRDMEAGRATFHILGPSSFDGVMDVMALYPDGRAFLWRELDERFRK
ncbi:MAG: DUF6446 family protein [Pseudomonadota bacterium]